mgnify:CR=1 FL=1|tara:strand:+ start:967 stop:1944 length:978 start_codon:yes stop_codon:yes gene_type:complete
MTTLITGCAGFVGYHLTKSIINKNKSTKIIGIDNMNSYYDIKLKRARKKNLEKLNNKNFIFYKIDITNRKKIEKLFLKYNINCIYHLAAQAGVRFSINSPDQYIKSNVLGFFNLLECAKKFKVKKFFFASSSSVYGNRKNNLNFKEDFNTSSPVSFYAATKKTNEIMAYSYSNLYNIKILGLRFFTAYGPYGRPDMAYYKFTKKIINGKKIDLFNNGNHMRDFTYIDDVINAILILEKNFKKIKSKFEIFNIGASRPISLKFFLSILEKNLGKKAKTRMISFQKGDVTITRASISKLTKLTGFRPRIEISDGIKKFIKWYKDFHK